MSSHWRPWWLCSFPSVFFLLLFPLLSSLVFLHPGVHHLEVTSDSSWPAHLAAHTLFGYDVGDLAFLLAEASLLVETMKQKKQVRGFLLPFSTPCTFGGDPSPSPPKLSHFLSFGDVHGIHHSLSLLLGLLQLLQHLGAGAQSGFIPPTPAPAFKQPHYLPSVSFWLWPLLLS